MLQAGGEAEGSGQCLRELLHQTQLAAVEHQPPLLSGLSPSLCTTSRHRCHGESPKAARYRRTEAGAAASSASLASVHPPSLSPVQMAPMRWVPAKKARESTKGRSPSGPHSSKPRFLRQRTGRAGGTGQREGVLLKRGVAQQAGEPFAGAAAEPKDGAGMVAAWASQPVASKQQAGVQGRGWSPLRGGRVCLLA